MTKQFIKIEHFLKITIFLITASFLTRNQYVSARISTDSMTEMSKLNTIELENSKYNIDIDNEMKVDSNSYGHLTDENKEDFGFIQIRSKHGQLYECKMPTKSERFEEDPEENEEGPITSFFGNTLSSATEKSQYNFSLINEKINRFKKESDNMCIYRNLGWWTYELCYGRHVKQYHVMGNGTIMGEKISLGNYTGDFKWLEANKTNIPISSGILYHEQYYENGSMCELSGKPRKTIIKIFCDETVKNQIDLISEVETCVYEINVNSNQVCSIPSFSKKSNDFSIKCNPVINADQFEKYSKKKSELDAIESLKKAKLKYQQLIKEDINKVDNSEKKTGDTPLKMTSIMSETAKANKEQILNNLDSQKTKIENMQNEISSELSKSEKTFTDLTENAQKFKKIISQVELNKISGENEQNKNFLTEAQQILTKQVDDFLKTDEVFDKLTNQLNDLIDNLNFDDEKEGDETNLAKSFDEKNEILSEKLRKIKEQNDQDIKRLDESIDRDAKEDVEITTIDENKLGDTTISNTEVDPEDRIKILENKIVESLSKSNKYAEKFKNGDIKIKIITLNSDPNEFEESDELKYLLSGLFDKNLEYEKLKKLKNNYHLAYDSNTNMLTDNRASKEKDDQEEVIQADMVYFDESEKDEDNEKYSTYTRP